jgi:hypothetical protein
MNTPEPTGYWILWNTDIEGEFFCGMFTSKAKAEAYRDAMIAKERADYEHQKKVLMQYVADGQIKYDPCYDAPFKSGYNFDIEPGQLDPQLRSDGAQGDK